MSLRRARRPSCRREPGFEAGKNLAYLSDGLLIADEDLFTGNAASTEVLVCPPGLQERDPDGHDGLDLPLREELEERGGVLPEPFGMAVAQLCHLEGQDPLTVRQDVSREHQRPD